MFITKFNDEIPDIFTRSQYYKGYNINTPNILCEIHDIFIRSQYYYKGYNINTPNILGETGKDYKILENKYRLEELEFNMRNNEKSDSGDE